MTKTFSWSRVCCNIPELLRQVCTILPGWPYCASSCPTWGHVMDSFHEICAALPRDNPMYATTLITEGEIQSPSKARKDPVRNLFLLCFAFSEKVVIRQNIKEWRHKSFRLRLYMIQSCTNVILGQAKKFSTSFFVWLAVFVFCLTSTKVAVVQVWEMESIFCPFCTD